jgi:mannose-1-phosphate guanylyltransferase
MPPREDREIRGVILAGDHPWNESSLDSVLPRVLAPVVFSPLICYPLRWLQEGGVPAMTICANSESRQVRKCLGDGSEMGIAIDYYEDWTPRGPAGCIRDAALQTDADALVVVEGAVIPRFDLCGLLDAHTKAEAAVTVVVNSDRSPSTDNGPGDYLAPAGIYVFQREALEHVSETGYQDIKEVLIPQLYLAHGRVVTYLAEKECPRVSDAASYLSVNGWMLSQIISDRNPLPGYRKVGESRVHRNAQLADTAKLVGPVLVGPFTEIADGATIVGPTVIGVGSSIEGRAVVSRSVILDRCFVGEGSVVDQCAIMHGASVEPGDELYHMIQHVGQIGARRQGGSLWTRLLPKRKNGEVQTTVDSAGKASGRRSIRQMKDRMAPGKSSGGVPAGSRPL